MSRPEPWLMALVAKNGLDNLCRVCLASGNADLGYMLINIFEPPNLDTTSGFLKADVLHTICDIELSEDDHLPKRICPVCFSRLEDAYNLRQQSQTTQQALYEVLAEVTSASENAARNNENQHEHEISQKDLCATQYNTANSEMVSEEESTSDTEYDKELLFEVEYLNVSELSLKDDKTFEKGQTSKQAKKIIRCCGCDTVFETELQLRKHSIRKHRPRSEVDVPDGKVPCNPA